MTWSFLKSQYFSHFKSRRVSPFGSPLNLNICLTDLLPHFAVLSILAPLRSAPLTFRVRWFSAVKGCPVGCRILSSTAGLYATLDARNSTLLILPIKKMSPDLVRCWRGTLWGDRGTVPPRLGTKGINSCSTGPAASLSVALARAWHRGGAQRMFTDVWSHQMNEVLF